MGIKKSKPTPLSRRYVSFSTFEEVTKSEPLKSLCESNSKKSGRNNNGRITVRRRGGGHKRLYRIIDFKRCKDDVEAKVVSIEYDPNRSSRIALLQYIDGEKSYIIAPEGLKVDDKIMSGKSAEIEIGNCMELERMPLGSQVHNIELKIGKGAQIARSAGSYAILMAKESGFALLKFPSGELRKVHLRCRATLGQVSNTDHENVTLGKAGRTRYLGKRPKVRGVAMNPVDHPMGGGEGKTSGGRHPCTPWGVKTKGKKTRTLHKLSDKYIVKRRNK